jgi:ribosomal protein S18 acetylase RimI-like enzyme
MLIEPAQEQDLSEILVLQKISYRTEAELYDDWNIAPLAQTLPRFQTEFGTKIILKAVDGPEIVGSVRGYVREQTGFIERLITHPGRQNQGIGTALLAALEARMKDATRFRLFTGHLSVRNIAFYQKRGYLEFKREPVNDKLVFLWFEKANGWRSVR